MAMLLGSARVAAAADRVRYRPLLRAHHHHHDRPVFLELYDQVRSFLDEEGAPEAPEAPDASPEAIVGAAANAAGGGSGSAGGEAGGAGAALQAVAAALPEAAGAAGAVQGIAKKAEAAGVSTGAEVGGETGGAEADADADNMPTPAEFTQRALDKNKKDVAAQEAKDTAMKNQVAQEKAWQSTTTLPPNTPDPPATTSAPATTTTPPATTTPAPIPINGHKVSIASRHGPKFGQTACVRNAATRRPRPSGGEYEMLEEKWLDVAVMCCADNFAKDEVKPKRKINDKCRKGVTYDLAKSVCQGMHWRLCTSAEVQDGIGDGSGCNFDKMHVWTSDTCDASKKAPMEKQKETEENKFLGSRVSTTAAPEELELPKSTAGLFDGGMQTSDSDKADMEGIVILEGVPGTESVAPAGNENEVEKEEESEIPPDTGAANNFLQTAATSVAANSAAANSAGIPATAIKPDTTLNMGALLPPSGKGTSTKVNMQAEKEGLASLAMPTTRKNKKTDLDEDVSIFQPESIFGERTADVSGISK